MSKAALVVVFNHKYEKNIPRLEQFYGDRFSHRRYLVPFASGSFPNTIRVVESGWYFSGHIAQGLDQYKAGDVTHYVFLGDDLILNPALHQHNLVEGLELAPGAGYIKSLASADAVRFRWPWAIYAYRSLLSPKFDYSRELPPPAEAAARFKALGIHFPTPYPRSLKDRKWLEFPFRHRSLRNLHWNLKFVRPYLASVGQHAASIGKPSTYPLLAGYSDFVVVPAESIDLFTHFCGVFAAMNMFAEIAVPTALALACSSVQTELVMGDHFGDAEARFTSRSKLRGVEFWEQGIEVFCQANDFSWSHLMENYPDDVLYYHPVKLSMWK